jgi:tRNA A37 threonylcarbamoyladenosine synthetase subunit TsaC/SUA5/YrdC
VPDTIVILELLAAHGAPLLSTTLIAPDESEPINDPDLIETRFANAIDVIIDAGACHLDPTTVVDLTPMGDGGAAVLIRQGRGELAALGL